MTREKEASKSVFLTTVLVLATDKVKFLCPFEAGIIRYNENLLDIAKSREASMDNKEFCSLFQILTKATSCHLSVEVFQQIAQRLSRDLNKVL